MNDLQRTNDWFAARLGKVTASRVADVIAKTKTGYSASRANYMAEMIVERLTGAPSDSYQSPAMLWGINTEPLARAAYEAKTGNLVDVTGFVSHPSIQNAGASPDGLIGLEGLVEIKCPNTATHIDTILDGRAPSKYMAQMQWQMACTGRSWCDFASFDPRVPDAMKVFVVRVDRDSDMIADLEKEVVKFLAEVDAKLSALKERVEMDAF